jgi:hypothetical protein
MIFLRSRSKVHEGLAPNRIRTRLGISDLPGRQGAIPLSLSGALQDDADQDLEILLHGRLLEIAKFLPHLLLQIRGGLEPPQPGQPRTNLFADP